MTDAYKQAGVDIERGNEFVNKIKTLVASTQRRGAIGSIGSFGGLFELDTHAYKHPVLVASTDGVGTKLKLAIEMKTFDTVGQDLVAMCVNDIACSGAEPLFFLDYLATGKLKPDQHAEVIKGIADACKICNCALIGGETAEMPGMYTSDDFDLAGFVVGVVEKDDIIDGHAVGLGDAIVGFASSGFHSNGYSLVRKIVTDHDLDLSQPLEGLDKPLGHLLLAPTKLYSPLIGRLQESFTIKAIAHITGGGILENLPRVLPSSVQATIEKNSWEIPPLMRFFQERGDIDEQEMLRVFNCGIGLTMVVPKDQAEALCSDAQRHGEEACIIGTIEKRTGDTPVFIR
jgi:phosphoribosylformylglycinamidine cyclo-ligase